MNQTLIKKNTVATYQITNNCGVPLLVLQAGAALAEAAEIHMYEQTLVTLPTAGTNKVLYTGKTASVSFETAPDQIYTLILAQADNLFPVKVAPVLLANGTSDIMLQATQDDFTNMRLAATFVQTVSALPSSELAKDYAKALSNTDLSSTKGFFESTADYKTLTTEMVAAVQTYYNTYLWIWANYSTNKVYTMYTSEGAAATRIGTLTLSSVPTTLASTDKLNQAFAITYQPDAASGSSTLTYAANTFENTDKTISLHGFFDIAGGSSKDPSSATIISGIRGTVGGVEVLGYDESSNTGKPWISIDGLIHPEDLKDKLQITGISVGLFVLLVAIVSAVAASLFAAVRIRAIKARSNSSDETDPDFYEYGNMEESQIEIHNKAKAAIQEKISNWVERSNAHNDFEFVLERAAKVRSMLEILKVQDKMLEALVKYNDSDKIQELADRIYATNEELRTASTQYKSNTQLDILTKDISGNTVALKEMYTTTKEMFRNAEIKSFEANVVIIDQLTSEVKAEELTEEGQLNKNDLSETSDIIFINPTDG